jgi:hypothetical protein
MKTITFILLLICLALCFRQASSLNCEDIDIIAKFEVFSSIKNISTNSNFPQLSNTNIPFSEFIKKFISKRVARTKTGPEISSGNNSFTAIFAVSENNPLISSNELYNHNHLKLLHSLRAPPLFS